MKHVNNIVFDQYSSKRLQSRYMFWCFGIDPLNQNTWYEWVDKIKTILLGGSLFNIEYKIDVDVKYAMLTEYFHGMKSEEKKSLIYIIKKHDILFSVQCVRDIHIFYPSLCMTWKPFVCV